MKLYFLGRGVSVGAKLNQLQHLLQQSMPERIIPLWWGEIPIEAVATHILIRDVGLDANEKLDQTTLYLYLAAKLKIPHHQSAGEEDDFNFQRGTSTTSEKKLN